ncbi:hypothetical protein [Bacillus horti]|uniref:DUF4367 domain-containing protein n=1 Tax=Caldalkalibacillus horti TaxID=77523 RepID=A0ABT9W310_9BACI|nr:hypothetical protein [Bacillus horti]MDQ0167638.1 hypothetical protein [Bacillus horti]
MRKFTSNLFIAGVCIILSLSIIPMNSVKATGNSQVWWTDLPSSGTGGSTVRNNSITGWVAENCGGVYDIRYNFSFGSYNQNSFRLNSHSVLITSISQGGVLGGASLSYNLEDSNTVVYNTDIVGVRLQQGRTYTSNWNRTIPLGSTNRGVQIQVSTISGHDSSVYVCGTEDSMSYLVGRSNLANKTAETTISNEALSYEVVAQKESFSNAISNDYYLADEPKIAGGAILNHYRDRESGDLLVVAIQETPIEISNLEENDFSAKIDGELNYEFAINRNQDGEELSVIKYENEGIYTLVVSKLGQEKLLEVIKSAY